MDSVSVSFFLHLRFYPWNCPLVELKTSSCLKENSLILVGRERGGSETLGVEVWEKKFRRENFKGEKS